MSRKELQKKRKNKKQTHKNVKIKKAVVEDVKTQKTKNLEFQLISEEKAYKETIKEVTMSSRVVFQELILSLENLRNKEKEQRTKVEKLREKV